MLQHSRNCDIRLAGCALSTGEATEHKAKPQQSFLRMKIKKNKRFNCRAKGQQMHLKMILKNKSCALFSWP